MTASADVDTVSDSRCCSLPDTRMSAQVGGGRGGCEPVAGAVALHMSPARRSRRLGASPRSLEKSLRVRGIAFVERAFWEAEDGAVLLARRARRQPVAMVCSSAAVFRLGRRRPMATRILRGPVVKDRADRTDSTVAGDQRRRHPGAARRSHTAERPKRAGDRPRRGRRRSHGPLLTGAG